MTKHPIDDPSIVARVGALIETALLLVGGAIIARAAAGVLELPTRQWRDALLFGSDGPQWRAAADAEALALALRYGVTFLLVICVVILARGPGRRMAGLSTGGRNPFSLIGFGVVMAAVTAAPAWIATILHRVSGVGGSTPVWDLIAQAEWTSDFWLFMAVSSFALVPLIEELFFRSYALGRYRMHFSPGGAILLSAAFFWVSHGQYLKADPFLLFNSGLTFAAAAIWAWSVVRTGSILPAIVAHMIVNVPMTVPALAVAALSALAIIGLNFKAVGREAGGFMRTVLGVKERIFLLSAVGLLFGLAALIRAEPRAVWPTAAMLGVIMAFNLARRFRRGTADDRRPACGIGQ